MECPNCGFEQPDADECAACGIIFSKWEEEGQRPPRRQREEASQERPMRPQNPATFLPGGVSGWYGGEASSGWGAADAAPPTGPPAARPSAPTKRASSGSRSAAGEAQSASWATTQAPQETNLPPGADAPLAIPVLGAPARRPPRSTPRVSPPKPKPAGPALKAIRLGAALGCLVIAVVLFLNGQALASPLVFGLAAVALGFFVWGVTTARVAVGRRQIFTELGAVATLSAVVAIFSSTLLSPPPSTRPTRAAAPAATPQAKRVLPDTPLGHLSQATQAYLDALDALLALRQEASFGFWQRTEQALSLTRLQTLHDALSDDDRARAFELWQHLRPLGDAVDAVLKSAKKPSPDGFTFHAPDDTRAKLLQRSQATREVLRDLRQAIEVFE